MIKLFKFLIFAFLTVLVAPVIQAEEFTIGVWNIENLNSSSSRGFPELRGNDALGPRSTSDLSKISDYLNDDVKTDALMLTEIGKDDKGKFVQLEKIISNLDGNWEFEPGSSGGKQRIVFLYDADKVKLKKVLELEVDEHRVRGKDIYDRDPLIVWIEFLDPNLQDLGDVMIVGLHLKSQQKFVHNHMAATATLMGFLADTKIRKSAGLPAKSKEKDIIILGDLNDSAFTRSNYTFMFDYLEGVGYLHAKPQSGAYPRTRTNGSKIDHIFVSSSLKHDEYEPISFTVHHISGVDHEDYREIYSYHYPVTITLSFED